jgi:hypothetical protein
VYCLISTRSLLRFCYNVTRVSAIHFSNQFNAGLLTKHFKVYWTVSCVVLGSQRKRSIRFHTLHEHACCTLVSTEISLKLLISPNS